jgi:hypothetical protein
VFVVVVKSTMSRQAKAGTIWNYHWCSRHVGWTDTNNIPDLLTQKWLMDNGRSDHLCRHVTLLLVSLRWSEITIITKQLVSLRWNKTIAAANNNTTIAAALG